MQWRYWGFSGVRRDAQPSHEFLCSSCCGALLCIGGRAAVGLSLEESSMRRATVSLRRSALFVVALLLAGSAFLAAQRQSQGAQTSGEVPPDLPALAQAKQVTQQLSAGLQKLLGEELAQGGFVGAVKVCSERAQTVTGEFNVAMGASARRVSLRYRNPNDQPDPYERAVLQRWQEDHNRQKLPAERAQIITEADGTRHLRYMKPIVVQAMCLTCHGEPARIPDEVKQILGSRYPQDLATGYAAGDLRGAVSVRIPLNGQ